jgi:hypothetical protein
MSDIIPTEAEFAAVNAIDLCYYADRYLSDPTRAMSEVAEIIATHTRYEGRDAEEWARLQQQTAFVVREVSLRAEAAEAKVTELEAKLDAAIAEAVSKRTVECDRVASEWMREHGTMDVWTGLHLAIIALNAPPAPAYPFGKDATGRQCACWEQNDRLWWNKDGDYPHDLDAHYTHCPFCGAPRTKGI